MQKFRRAAGLLLVAMLAAMLLTMTENQTKSDLTATTLENRLRKVLASVEGAGAVELLVNEAETGEIVGVCVLSEGADDVATVFRIQRAVRTALGIENEKIEVIRMEGDGR